MNITVFPAMPATNRSKRWNSASLVSLGLLALSLLTVQVSSYKSSPHYGAGRRIKMEDIKTLTFYAGANTAYRRTNPLPQLICQGSPCQKFQPDAIQCTSTGDSQWQCSADLPTSMRMGRVEVSCEGYDYSEDSFVLKDSCALTYHLLPSFGPDEDFRGGYHRSPRGSQVYNLLLQLIFWSLLGYIAYSFIKSLRQPSTSRDTPSDGRGGGSGGGGGGGWGPGRGGDQAPPPPYMKDEHDAGASSASISALPWRPGFWTGLGLGGVAATALNGNQNRVRGRGRGRGWPDSALFNSNERDRPDNNGDGYRSSFGRASTSSTSDGAFRSSSGFGGTRNR